MHPSEQQSKAARSGFVIKKVFSSLISSMNKWTFILFLLLFLFPPSQGENHSVQTFFCKPPGCAADVTDVLCNDEQVFDHNHIANCTGLPPPNTICQHGGQVFTSIDTKGECEFEGIGGYITTRRCTDSPEDCAFISTSTSPTVTENKEKNPDHKYITCGIGGSVLVLIIIGGLSWYFCKRRNKKQSDSQLVNLPLRQTQSPKGTNERSRMPPV